MRTKNRGLTYLRRSTTKQEISLSRQLDWATGAARANDVTLIASETDLSHMLSHRLHRYEAIRLDDGVSGSDLSRPGFVALIDDALKDRAISHVFFYKRDRFARPDDALKAAQIEKQLRLAGITLVHSDGIAGPLRRGEQDLVRDLEPLLAYYQGGEELRKHAERVLDFQQKLAADGYRVGGNAPYGFVRALVDSAGRVLEELPRGKTVRQAGCHVRAIPKFLDKVAIWLQILEWKEQGWGVKRIAKTLNDRGIPSPDAGRTRTDHGVKHLVSGQWSHNTVSELCKNPIFIGVQQYGKRSEGKIRRLGTDGARYLDEGKDCSSEGRPRTVINDPELRIRTQVGEPQFDAKRWGQIQDQMRDRGQSQRNVPRAKDPARYPLSCRLVDLTDGCGSVFYGRMAQKRPVYTCSRYMRSEGAECASNQVDAEAMLRFTLKTLKQFVEVQGHREKLRRKLLERARREAREPRIDPRATELARLRSRQSELRFNVETIEFRMARERNDELYAALARQFEAERAALEDANRAIERHAAEERNTTSCDPEEQADSALKLLDDVLRISMDPAARAGVNPLLKQLNLRIGLRFQPAIKGRKRKVQRLLCGQLVLGNASLPVPLFAKNGVADDLQDSCCSNERATAAGKVGRMQAGNNAAANGLVHRTATEKTAEGMVSSATSGQSGQTTLGQPNDSQSEGISITKVSRGDWI